MSWDSYRDSLVGTGCVDKAAVCGAEDGAVWTQSQGFNVSQQSCVDAWTSVAACVETQLDVFSFRITLLKHYLQVMSELFWYLIMDECGLLIYNDTKKATRYGIGEAYSSVIGLLKSIDYSVVWLRRRIRLGLIFRNGKAVLYKQYIWWICYSPLNCDSQVVATSQWSYFIRGREAGGGQIEMPMASRPREL